MFSQLLDVLAQAMEYLLRFFYNWTGNYGISIILLTLFIRLILSPLIHKTESLYPQDARRHAGVAAGNQKTAGEIWQ